MKKMKIMENKIKTPVPALRCLKIKEEKTHKNPFPVYQLIKYPIPNFVVTNCVKPADSNFFRSLVIFTVKVLSSTKLSVSHNCSISFSLLTTFPLFFIRVNKMRYSFFVKEIT